MANGQEINASAWYSVCKINLTPGTWIVSGSCYIMVSGSVVDASLYQRIVNGNASKQYAADMIYTYQRNMQTIAFVDIDKEQNIFLQVYASTSVQVYSNEMRAIRIK